MLDQALEVTQSGLTEARRALGSLRASPLDDLGLALAIREMAKSTAARTNLRLDLDLQNHIEISRCGSGAMCIPRRTGGGHQCRASCRCKNTSCRPSTRSKLPDPDGC